MVHRSGRARVAAEEVDPVAHRRLTVLVDEREHVTIVRPEGELDLASAPQFEAACARCAAAGRDLTIDMRGLSFLDCSGLRALLRVAADAPRLSMIPGDERVQRVIDLTGAGRLLPLGGRLARAA